MNPAWGRKSDGTGKSGNPGGQPARKAEFRAKCIKEVDESVFPAWVEEVRKRGPDWMRAAELLAAYGYGRPAQSVHVDGDVTIRRAEDLTDDELVGIIAGEGAVEAIQ
jgi:hypothetical protein